MILSCPPCQARYLVPAVHFAAGPRNVRCARCGHTWLAVPPEEPAVVLAEQLSALSPPSNEINRPAPAIPSHLPVVPEEPKRFWRRDWFLATIATVLALFVLFVALDRRDIAARWPETEKFYDAIGLHVFHPGEGLSLRDVYSESAFEGGRMRLNVKGTVHNETLIPQPIPDILAAAIGPEGKTMTSWQIDAPAATVEAGQDVPFISAINAPEGTVTQIHLRFIESGNAQ